jgi:hypothetical protein
VLTIWQCQLKSERRLESLLVSFLTGS